MSCPILDRLEDHRCPELSDFFVAVTASSRVLYVFVVMEIGTRRMLHFNLTAHATAECTLQQFQEVIPG